MGGHLRGKWLVLIVLACSVVGMLGISAGANKSVSAIGWVCAASGERVSGAEVRLFDRFPMLHGSTWASVEKELDRLIVALDRVF